MKQNATTDAAPQADHILSQAVVAGDFIFVSGQVHNGPDGKLVEGTALEKLAQIMANIDAILNAAAFEMDDVVKVTIYVTDMAQMPELNAAYPGYFAEPYPAREAVCVKELPLGATIEISVIGSKA